MSRAVVAEYDEDTGQMVTRTNPARARHNARANLLRVMESKRKLLGIDRPVQVDVVTKVTHDDPASVGLKTALEEAARRRDEALAEIRTEEEI